MKLNFLKRKADTPESIAGVVRYRFDDSRLSAANVESLKSQLLPMVTGQSAAVFECRELTFIDSSGLGLLVGLRNAMLAPQKVVLEGITDPTLLELIKLTRMDQIFILSSHSRETQQLIFR